MRPQQTIRLAAGILGLLAVALVNPVTLPAALPGVVVAENVSSLLLLVAIDAIVAAFALWLVATRNRGFDLGATARWTLYYVVFIGFILELGLRAIVALTPPAYPEIMDSVDRGWEMAPNVHWDAVSPRFGSVSFSTREYGFRTFGDLDSIGPRVLVLGDSFTMARSVSDGQAYYDVWRRHSPELQVFAYGCSGYSSLQEYLALKRFHPLIKPTVVVWQLCSNDLVANVYAFEARSYLNTNYRVRPYLEGGGIRFHYPVRGGDAVEWIVTHSRLAAKVHVTGNLVVGLTFGAIENDPARGRELKAHAVDTTANILKMAKAELHETPLLCFVSEQPIWMGDALEQACLRARVRYFAGVPEAIAAANAQGRSVNGGPSDPHWNTEGHRIVGETLLPSILELLPP